MAVQRMSRRRFLATAASLAVPLASGTRLSQSGIPPAGEALDFVTDHGALQGAYRAALECLKLNTTGVFGFPHPVLIEGSVYRGVWLECAPHEGLVYSRFDPDIGVANHRVFFDSQRADGYIHCNVKADTRGTGQIQMVVPIAATAWELYERFRAAEFLEAAYRACSRWDDWLMRYRNTRATGLCEGFCEYDTGHDNSPRWKGIPKQCPDRDARLMPRVAGLPRLCPDLSATVYGGRVALARMAGEMGLAADADRWRERAESIRMEILTRLYDSADACFYDLDAEDRFVRIRGDLLTRVLGEHVVDPPMFQKIYRKQIRNPKSFWAPYPFPSIALDDPTFVRPIPRNSWGGASQALTALRAPRWMEHYGRPADLAYLMKQWVTAILDAGGYLGQQMDPLTGKFTTTDPGGYSPAALVLLDFIWRIHGVCRVGEVLEWNCRPPEKSSRTSFSLQTPNGTAEIRHSRSASALMLAGRELLSVTGVVRVLTDLRGRVTHVVGTEAKPARVHLAWKEGKTKRLTVGANAKIPLEGWSSDGTSW
jgi:hypothetical protein